MERLPEDVLLCVALASSTADSSVGDKYDAAKSLLRLAASCKRFYRLFGQKGRVWPILWQRDFSEAGRVGPWAYDYLEGLEAISSLSIKKNLTVCLKMDYERAADYFARKGGKISANMIEASISSGRNAGKIIERWLGVVQATRSLIVALIRYNCPVEWFERAWRRLPTDEANFLNYTMLQSSRMDVARFLIRQGCRFDEREADSVLLLAVRYRNLDRIRVLCELGIDVRTSMVRSYYALSDLEREWSVKSIETVEKERLQTFSIPKTP